MSEINIDEIIDVPLNVYEEDVNEETSCDFSNKKLTEVPCIPNKIICALYLQNNQINELPEDFFPSLPSLMWLDLRDNLLTEIPKTIVNHPSLTHFLLQNNKLTALPLELGTVASLKVLHLSGNPLTFPPKDIQDAGAKTLIDFLHKQYLDEAFAVSKLLALTDRTENSVMSEFDLTPGAESYNSVLDEKNLEAKPLAVTLFEKEVVNERGGEATKLISRCRKLPPSRSHPLPPFCSNSKYMKAIRASSSQVTIDKIKEDNRRSMTLKKKKESLAAIEKTLQDRKNMEVLRKWRQQYRYKQLFVKEGARALEPKDFPYDTTLEYMTLLSREDIEKDLPDKYRKKLVRRSKPTTARKNNADVHLAMKIKQLFENLEAIDLSKDPMTPRTEQKALLQEIQKITEIKQKLDELSISNIRSVMID